MEQLVSMLVRLYGSAISFLVAIVVALIVVAALAKYVTGLAVLLVLAIALRIVWARTAL